jgi:hypothetical protein
MNDSPLVILGFVIAWLTIGALFLWIRARERTPIYTGSCPICQKHYKFKHPAPYRATIPTDEPGIRMMICPSCTMKMGGYCERS